MIYKGFKRDLLMFLAILSDFYREISYNTAYKRLYWPDYKPRYISQVISRMAKTGEIQKEVRNGEPVLKLTARGWRIFDEVISLRKQKKWDGIWRIVIFDIKEENRYLRDSLRRKLKEFGFGKWQRSVYITPHNIMREMNEFLEMKSLFPKCVCLESRRTGIGDDRKLAAYVFQLEYLSDKYEDLILRIKSLREKAEGSKLSPAETRKQFRDIWEKYKELMLSDPYLPIELLPKDWPANETQREFSRLVGTVRKLRLS